MRPSTTSRLVLIALFVVGIGLNFFIILDAEWLHWLLVPPGAATAGGGGGDGALVPDTRLETLRRSIVLVVVQGCEAQEPGVSSGTGFVVDPSYVATAAHVIADAVACGNPVVLVDHEGREHRASPAGLDAANDLGLVRADGLALPPLTLADSGAYEQVDDLIGVVTVGYPLVGAASRPDAASVSGQGNVSNYDGDQRRFITSGMNVNPGNSGGPVFLRRDWTVLGVASAKLDSTVAEGIGVIVPVNLLRELFEQETGRRLP